MIVRRPAVALAILGVALSAGGTASSEPQDQSAQPEMTPEMEAEMAAWMKLAQPGEHHQHLAPFEGSWKGEIKMWMAPDTDAMVNESAAEASWILGGRYLEWTHTGEFDGMPFEGRALDAFNNGDGRYESIWVDNFGTLIIYYQGECSDDGKSRVMTGSFTDAVGGGTIHQRAVYTWLDDDHFIYESYMTRGDVEYKNMEIRYARQ